MVININIKDAFVVKQIAIFIMTEYCYEMKRELCILKSTQGKRHVGMWGRERPSPALRVLLSGLITESA